MSRLIIQLKSEGLRVLIVGGGQVGQRKAAHLLSCGALVRLVALEPQPHQLRHDRLEWLHEAYQPKHMAGVQLVIAAANAEVHQQVHAEAQRRGLWVCDASTPELGNVTFPAVRQVNSISVAVSTNGLSPGAAQSLAELFSQQVDQATLDWLELLSEIRHLLQTLGKDSPVRQHLLRDLAGIRWVEQLRQRGREAVWQEWLEKIPN